MSRSVNIIKKNPIEIIKDLRSSDPRRDPFMLIDLDDIRRKHAYWKLKLPRVDPHYAVKSNPEETILVLMVELGVGFDCASLSEMEKMLGLGVSPDRIVLSNPVKPNSYLTYAREHGIERIAFDNEEELIKIKRYFPKAKCVLRMKSNDELGVSKFDMKYGADMETSFDLVKKAHGWHQNTHIFYNLTPGLNLTVDSK